MFRPVRQGGGTGGEVCRLQLHLVIGLHVRSRISKRAQTFQRFLNLETLSCLP